MLDFLFDRTLVSSYAAASSATLLFSMSLSHKVVEIGDARIDLWLAILKKIFFMEYLKA
ncbi:hypothetical protein [Paenibacillus sp. N3.4]|uniref:hypothetical protein n=1 Tax=Paenibacillus sp. N3.4 TaxID=2603222 RepID=UPI001C9CC4D0|nr:hypothetical protein [Paenibacillus sp. N3.4]